MKVKEIILEVFNGYTLPVYILENGDRYVPRHTSTGSCWITDWVKAEEFISDNK